MNVAILCPGPSLARSWPADRVPEKSTQFGAVLAVNRAALVGPYDWWVAGDWMYLKDTDAKPKVGYCTIRDVVRILQDGSLLPKERMPERPSYIAWEDLPFQRSFSVVAALGLACHLGAEEVFIYGDDKSGTQDFDGRTGENRGHGRWEEEILAMNAGIEFLATQGIMVTHVKG